MKGCVLRHIHHRVRVLLLVATASSLVCAATTSAQQARPAANWSFYVLDLVITEPIFEEICDLLLSQAQREHAADLHSKYLESAKALEQQAYEEMLDAGWREIEQLEEERRQFRLLRKDLRLTPEERERAKRKHEEKIDSLMTEPVRVSALAKREADKLLDRLLQDLTPILSDEQLVVYERVPAMIRRLCYFHRGAGRAYQDFQHPIDLFDLLETAGTREEELLFMPEFADPWSDTVEGIPEDLVVEIRAALSAYETRFDRIMRARLQRLREIPDEDTKWTLDTDNPQDRREMKRIKDVVGSGFRALTDAVEQIGHSLSVHVNSDAATKWGQHFHSNLCPNLMRPHWADGMLDWLNMHDPTEEQLAAAQSMYADYSQEKGSLIGKIIKARIMAKRRGSKGDNLRLALSADEKQRKLKDLREQVIRRFYQILTEDQKALLQQEIGS